jgi:hypothetical protein
MILDDHRTKNWKEILFPTRKEQRKSLGDNISLHALTRYTVAGGQSLDGKSRKKRQRMYIYYGRKSIST